MATLQPGEKSRMYALGGIARGGAFRGGYVSGKAFITVDGVQRGFARTGTGGILIDSLGITDVLDETPNRCAFTLNGVIETTGGEIVITLGTKNSLTRWFAGYITQTEQIYVGQKPANVQTVCSAIDYTWLLGFVTVTRRYTGQSATDIIKDLIITYAAVNGFAATAVTLGLPVLDEITFTDEPLGEAITRILRRIGGYWYVDYFLNVHAFVGDEANGNGAPATLTPQHRSLAHFAFSMDRSQVLTRVFVEGRGSRLLSHVAIGDTMLPLDTVDMFEIASDVFLKASFQGSAGGATYLTFTGRVPGGAGSLVGPGLGPPGAPTVAMALGTGLSAGRYSYAYTFKTAAGETLPSPLGVVDVGAVIPAPAAQPSVAALQSPTGVDLGWHNWAYTYTVGSGETTPSPISDQIVTQAPLGTTGGISFVNQYGGGPLQKNKYYGYRVTYLGDAGGETIAAQYDWYGWFNDTLANWKGEVFIGQGNFNPGEANYKVPLGVSGMKIYRTHPLNNPPTSSTPHYFVANAALSADAPGTSVKGTYMDLVPDASLGALLPTANTAMVRHQKVRVTTVVPPGWPNTAVTGVKIYRTPANTTGPYKLVAAMSGFGTYDDVITDAALGAPPPSTNTAGNALLAVQTFNIAPGPAGTTARTVYRTVVNGSQLKAVANFPENVTTTWLDQIPDGSLGANAPTGDTSGLTLVNGQVAAGAITLPVANAGVFEAGGGWAVIGNGEQVIRYTGRTTTALTGIPGAGIGAITAAIVYNSTITTAPMLIGIPTSGTRAIAARDLTAGDEIYLVVQCDDATRQAALAADMHRGNGVRATWVQDRRLSVTEARARGQATLALHPLDDVRVTYTCRDLRTRAGKTITVNLPAPTSVGGTYKIQQVQIGNFRPHGDQYPTFTVDASNRHFSFEDLLRRAKVKE